ncbi:MAG TPA: CARDB domain-containing protein [Polyangiaceae bacterium]|nr:CARDB domain-containing protein [Polyangiaceae bacterium]
MPTKIFRNFAAVSTLSLVALGACADAGAAADDAASAPEAAGDVGTTGCTIYEPCLPPIEVPQKPNLVAVMMDGAYCTRNASGALVVRVRNAGTAAAGASHTLVDFGNVRYHRNTPSLAPGASVDLTVTIPSGCFGPDCHFAIEPDEYDVVDESQESNVVGGTCLG